MRTHKKKWVLFASWRDSQTNLESAKTRRAPLHETPQAACTYTGFRLVGRLWANTGGC